MNDDRKLALLVHEKKNKQTKKKKYLTQIIGQKVTVTFQ